MPDVNAVHILINGAVTAQLGNQLKEKESSHEVLASQMRVKIEAIDKYTYPDVVITSDDSEFLEHELDLESLINPMVIIEVLSDDTEAYDRGEKFEHYKLIETLQEYILISQHDYIVEKWVRNKNERKWECFQYSGLNQIVSIDSIECELALSYIYDQVVQDLMKKMKK